MWRVQRIICIQLFIPLKTMAGHRIIQTKTKKLSNTISQGRLRFTCHQKLLNFTRQPVLPAVLFVDSLTASVF